MGIKPFTQYYYASIRVVFILLVGLAIGINLIDLITYTETNPYTTPINLVTIVLLIGIMGMHFLLKVPLSFCFGSGIYFIIANIIVSQIFAERSIEADVLNLFRETVFFLLMLIFGGIFIHKKHAVIVFIILAGRYVYATYTLHHDFLSEHLAVFLLTFAAISVVVYFFSDILHTSTIELQDKQSKIAEVNEELKANSEELKATLEDLSNKNERLQELNLAKDKFFTIITHDLKNPINTLQGFVELLLVKGNQLDPEKRETYLTHVQTSTQSIQNLLDSLLEWSRSQSNRIKMAPMVISVPGMIESVFDYLSLQASQKHIQLINLAQPQHNALADYDMTFTILRNLVSNAIKFSYSGKKVSVVTEETSEQIIIRVIDEGVGISEKELSRLFKLDSTTSTPGTQNETGTGLGLLLCDEFVRKNGGTLHVSSQPGTGSMFWFTLPKSRV